MGEYAAWIVELSGPTPSKQDRWIQYWGTFREWDYFDNRIRQIEVTYEDDAIRLFFADQEDLTIDNIIDRLTALYESVPASQPRMGCDPPTTGPLYNDLMWLECASTAEVILRSAAREVPYLIALRKGVDIQYHAATRTRLSVRLPPGEYSLAVIALGAGLERGTIGLVVAKPQITEDEDTDTPAKWPQDTDSSLRGSILADEKRYVHLDVKTITSSSVTLTDVDDGFSLSLESGAAQRGCRSRWKSTTSQSFDGRDVLIRRILWPGKHRVEVGAFGNASSFNLELSSNPIERLTFENGKAEYENRYDTGGEFEFVIEQVLATVKIEIVSGYNDLSLELLDQIGCTVKNWRNDEEDGFTLELPSGTYYAVVSAVDAAGPFRLVITPRDPS